MKYFFVLGSHHALSAAELSAFFGSKAAIKEVAVQSGILLMDLPEIADSLATIRRLGGTVKFGSLIGVIGQDRVSAENLFALIKSHLGSRNGKYKFGLSVYGSAGIPAKDLAMRIKKYLKEQGASSRWVTSRDKNLSSVVVEQNKLISQGAEFVFFSNNRRILIGITEAVQPFKELSFRDYGRPDRDDRSGMLPPKLAQMMINLAQADPDKILWDAFCGSGTILTEAALLGFNRLRGTDISGKAVADTRRNMEWVKSKFRVNPEYEIKEWDARKLAAYPGRGRVGAVVSEGYLGPQRGRVDVARTVAELEKLYLESLEVFAKVVEPGGRIVLAWPQIRGRNLFSQGFNLPQGLRLEEPLPTDAGNLTGHTTRQTLLYKRPQQKVGREIIRLKVG